ncbi:hypothetical protein E2C01_075880 [Portunus trituberculatus]|uniref:Uncharacterized protein n=1 Tax=Portunus trituberculatus TaxID=210409 RepID=A0A5B7IG38_PORTR|nr:hypothetical protein [Portunus trituberculatus]
MMNAQYYHLHSSLMQTLSIFTPHVRASVFLFIPTFFS